MKNEMIRRVSISENGWYMCIGMWNSCSVPQLLRIRNLTIHSRGVIFYSTGTNSIYSNKS